ncbi:hypothetical protein C2G38_2143013 [Gigaspora rosea]|uniref:Uncharacterized protein n=1 Tax=Gigaspora rosea TaxID=44941 RepID=A0A397V2G0_9GLOM|nr:hypothetical protein C2G38_2143013 [Gigaspora rosea]
MSSSEPVKLTVEEDTPHRGEKISQYVFSPNMQYIVTWSYDDQSIVGWSITNDLTNDLSIEPINSLNTDDLKSLLKLDYLGSIGLGRASDCKQFIILYFRHNDFAIIDIITKSRQILNVQETFSETFYAHNNNIAFDIRKFYFICSREKERLIISFQNRTTKNSVTYILNPLTYTLDESPDTNVLHDILSQNYKFINDCIIKIDKNELSIKRLSQNENWKNHLQSKERYVGSSFFNTKEIKQFIQYTLDRYKSNQILTQSYSDADKEYPGEAYTWIVMTKYQCVQSYTYLKARIKSNLKETDRTQFSLFDMLMVIY